MKITKQIIGLLLALSTFTMTAQELSVDNSSSVNIERLPEYVVITSENTKLLGGMNINIASKKSNYENVLKDLEDLLQKNKNLAIRNQTDLLNAMSKLGFDYLDAYNASAGTVGAAAGEDVQAFGSNAKYRINMVFRKKMEFRD
ncbi:hypothetical protein K1F50_12565 [Muricauda oceani]|uniref:DUF541 domain-containing protein n=1 Tax=Flagellimonas oceani TaxID=2698672 RepID=A0A6G7J073_9FLAO|nr:hypothetical protein [Allomuricauda oceani]MBW8243635.1 hypothetical protein [Allomuricauda oceani]QII43998.1 hypothetical protein GVT53_04690 [Allomuricauda oceani]